MNHAKGLDNASGYFFFSGFLISKIPSRFNPIVAVVLSSLTITFYALGYILWLAGSFLHPDHPKKNDQWYGFAQFRTQHQISGYLGLVACLISLSAIMIPVVVIPAAWIFFISNAIWSISEYHKLRNPPGYDETYLQTKQSSYVHYAFLSTAISLVSALATTLIFLIPAASLAIILTSAIICTAWGILATEYWWNFSYGTQDIVPIQDSYSQSKQSLGPSMMMDEFPAPIQTQSLYHNQASDQDQDRAEYSCTLGQ